MAFLGQIFVQELVKVAVKEVVEVAAVATVAVTTTYVAGKAVGTIVDNWEAGISSSFSFPSGCYGSGSTFSGRMETIYDWWGNGLSYEEYQRLEDWGYDTRTECFPLDELKSIIRCEAKVGQPPVNEPGWEEKWEPPRDWDGRKKRVPNDKSKEKGYPHKNGDVWVPKEDQHGGPGWEVQHKDGRGHRHVGKDGKVRRH